MSSKQNIICDYCNVQLIKRNLPRHYRNSCPLIPYKIKEYYTLKYENAKHNKTVNHLQTPTNNSNSYNETINNDESHNAITNNNSHNDTINNNSYNGNTNITTNTTTNNIINNFDGCQILLVNPFGTFDFTIFTEQDKKEILKCGKSGHKAIELIMSKIMEHPSNYNAFISNKDHKEVTKISKNGEIIFGEINDSMEILTSYCTKAYDYIINDSCELVSNSVYENNKTTLQSIKEGVFEGKLSSVIKCFLNNCKNTNRKIINLYIQNNNNVEIKKRIRDIVEKNRKVMDKPFNKSKEKLLEKINGIDERIKNYSQGQESISKKELFEEKKKLKLKLKEVKKQNDFFKKQTELLDKCTVSNAYYNNKLLIGLQDL